MDDQKKIEAIFLADLFEDWSELIPVFLQKRFDCVGCSFKSFCRLSDTAKAYSLDYGEFVGEIEAVIQIASNKRSSMSRNGKESG